MPRILYGATCRRGGSEATFSSLVKTCPDCGITKPTSAFSLNAARPDGLQYYCKQCYSVRAARTYRERQLRRGKSVREQVAAPEGSKFCPGCREISPLDNWHKNATSSDGYASYCKNCRREQGKALHLKRTFGLTAAQHEALLAAQDGSCAICRDAPVQHIDHNHETGRVRGGLCGPCNMGLGQFRDDPSRLEAAAAYLRWHRRAAVRHQLEPKEPYDSPVEEAIRRLVA